MDLSQAVNYILLPDAATKQSDGLCTRPGRTWAISAICSSTALWQCTDCTIQCTTWIIRCTTCTLWGASTVVKWAARHWLRSCGHAHARCVHNLAVVRLHHLKLQQADFSLIHQQYIYLHIQHFYMYVHVCGVVLFSRALT